MPKNRKERFWGYGVDDPEKETRITMAGAAVEGSLTVEDSLAVEGSLTVEAALIMAVTLFLIASLLRGAFEVHSQVAGNLILQEALETASRGVGGEGGSDSVRQEAEQRLRQYFRCGNAEIRMRDTPKRLEGEVSLSPGGGISVRRFRPERFLRTLRALEPQPSQK